MTLVNTTGTSSPRRHGFALPFGQVALLFLLLGIGCPLILATIGQGALSAVLVLVFVSVIGLLLCRNIRIRLNDASLKILGYLWLIKLGVTLVLLYVSWMPQLRSDSEYDPVRYYFLAQELIDNDWSPDIVSLNYLGILYYYGAIFHVLGRNPVIPALINAFVTLAATLYVVKVGYELKKGRGARDWILAFALLLPEMLWFDAMTSRETLLAALLVFALLTTGRYLAQTAPLSAFKALLVIGLSVLAIAAVRTSMLLPVLASIIFMILLVRPQRNPLALPRATLPLLIAVILVLGLSFAGSMGGHEFELSRSIQFATFEAQRVALSTHVEWSENSIGMLLIPESLLQAIVFLPLRMVLYLVAPLPNVVAPVGHLLGGDPGAWQGLSVLCGSIINVLAAPFALASLVHSIRNRIHDAAPLMFHISYWITFMAIAGGNFIIHERYRVMATLLLWGCAWLGATTCSKNLIVRTSIYWYGLLTLGALFYFAYKFRLA